MSCLCSQAKDKDESGNSAIDTADDGVKQDGKFARITKVMGKTGSRGGVTQVHASTGVLPSAVCAFLPLWVVGMLW
jgi:hypothetical protein